MFYMFNGAANLRNFGRGHVSFYKRGGRGGGGEESHKNLTEP